MNELTCDKTFPIYFEQKKYLFQIWLFQVETADIISNMFHGCLFVDDEGTTYAYRDLTGGNK